MRSGISDASALLLTRCSALITASAFVRLENIFWHLRNRLFKPTEIDQGKAPHRLWKYFSRKHEAVPTPITLILWHFTLYLHHRPSPKKIKNKKVTNPLKFRFCFNKDADIVSKKYRYAGFSCQNIRQLTELIIVVTKNPAENPAKTLTESITNQSNGVPPCSSLNSKVYKVSEE